MRSARRFTPNLVRRFETWNLTVYLEIFSLRPDLFVDKVLQQSIEHLLLSPA